MAKKRSQIEETVVCRATLSKLGQLNKEYGGLATLINTAINTKSEYSRLRKFFSSRIKEIEYYEVEYIMLRNL